MKKFIKKYSSKRFNFNAKTNSEKTDIQNDCQGYDIKSKHCGRDKNGVFHCECGKCKDLFPEISQNGNGSGNDGCDCCYNGYDCVK